MSLQEHRDSEAPTQKAETQATELGLQEMVEESMKGKVKQGRNYKDQFRVLFMVCMPI